MACYWFLLRDKIDFATVMHFVKLVRPWANWSLEQACSPSMGISFNLSFRLLFVKCSFMVCINDRNTVKYVQTHRCSVIEIDIHLWWNYRFLITFHNKHCCKSSHPEKMHLQQLLQASLQYIEVSSPASMWFPTARSLALSVNEHLSSAAWAITAGCQWLAKYLAVVPLSLSLRLGSALGAST